jgi:antitoxin component YwqK of YwqJK toxin-antitoxin module
MYKSFWLLIGLFFLIGCSDLETTEVKDENGNVIEKYTRRKTDFAKQGMYQAFSPEGTLMEEANYVNDTLDGERRLYHENGKVQIKEQYDQGQFVGAYQTFYENGQMELEGTYTEGAMNGEWKRYYENGQLMEVVQFENNQENGPFIEYHDNGNLKAKGAYLDGDKEHGLLELFDEQGELERKMDCDKGICRTIWTRDSVNVQ